MKKFILILGFFACSTPVFADSALNSEEVRKIVSGGLNWLYSAQEESGHFRYEYAPFWDRYVDDDNIVRQTGALYILGEIAKRDSQKRFDLESPMTKSLSYFEVNNDKGSFNNLNFRCLLKLPSKCTLGGTSLALVGALDLVKAYPNTLNNHQNLIEDYKNYIMAMKIPEAGFIF